jgi:hypothetical protein
LTLSATRPDSHSHMGVKFPLPILPPKAPNLPPQLKVQCSALDVRCSAFQHFSISAFPLLVP